MVWFSSAHLDVAGRVVFVDVGHLVLDLCVCVCVGWGGGGGGQNVFGKFSSMSGISYLTCLPSFSDLSSLSLSYTHTHTHTHIHTSVCVTSTWSMSLLHTPHTHLLAFLQLFTYPPHTCLPSFNSDMSRNRASIPLALSVSEISSSCVCARAR